jgi:hypothetical protein
MKSFSPLQSLRARIADWTGIGGREHILYATSDCLYALRSNGARWSEPVAFRLNEMPPDAGLALAPMGSPSPAEATPSALVPDEFRRWIERWRGDQFTILLDSADEEIEIEEMPKARGRDRGKILERRVKQRFRDAALTTWFAPRKTSGKDAKEAPGKESADTCMMMVGLRQRNNMIQWVTAAVAAGARIAGIESLALRSSSLLGAAGSRTVLLASVQPGGVRQTLIHDGEVCFTRLQPLELPAPWERVEEELDRAVRFLMMARANLRSLLQAGNYSVLVLAEGIGLGTRAGARPASVRLRDAAVPVVWSGREDALASMGALPQFLGARLRARANYATRELRGNWFTARGLRFAWSLAIVSLVLAIGANVALQYALGDRLLATNAGPRMAAAEGTRAQAAALEQELAALPVSAQEMQSIVGMADELRSRHVDAPRMLRWIGTSVQADSGVRLDSVSWEPASLLSAVLSAAASTPTAAPAANTPGAPVDPSAPVPDSGSVNPPYVPMTTAVRVEVGGTVDTNLSKEAANDKARKLLQRLQDACSCTGRVLAWPYDPSMEAAFTNSLRASGKIPAARFAIELELPAPIVPKLTPGAADAQHASELTQVPEHAHG